MTVLHCCRHAATPMHPAALQEDLECVARQTSCTRWGQLNACLNVYARGVRDAAAAASAAPHASAAMSSSHCTSDPLMNSRRASSDKGTTSQTSCSFISTTEPRISLVRTDSCAASLS